MKNKLTFLFDGGCPLCLRETNFLKKRDISNQIAFIDIRFKVSLFFRKFVSLKQSGQPPSNNKVNLFFIFLYKYRN